MTTDGTTRTPTAHCRPGDFLDFPATGRTITYVSHEFYRIADGLVAEEWICSNMATLYRPLS